MQPLTPLTQNPLAPDDKKNTEEFGLKVIRGCYTRWLNGYGGETFLARIARIYKNRLYAMGKQQQVQYIDWNKYGGEVQVLNIDYSPLAIAVPLLNAKIDRYMQREEKIRCKSFGPKSQNKKKEDKDKAKFKLNYKEAIQQLQQSSGLQLEEFSDNDPKSSQELDIQFKTTYKQKEEIIMQQMMDMVFDQNEWSQIIKPRLLMDIFCTGLCVTLTELDGNGWIKTPWVAPESFITSYSEFDDFRDWQWQGRRISMSISEVRLRYPGKYNEQQLWELSQRFKGKYGNSLDWFCDWQDYFITAAARPYDNVNVECVDLYYKTLYNLKYSELTSKRGVVSLLNPDEVKPEKNGKPNKLVTGEVKSPPYYVAYHGVWIIDTDEVLEWGLAKNMLKPNSNLVEIRSPYCVIMPNNVKCRSTPLVETMQPLIDMMQNIQEQTLRIIAVTAPDGFNVDTLGLSNLDMGEGVGVISPMQAWLIYLQTGNQYYRSKEPESDEPASPPIQPQNNQFSNKLQQLDEQWWSAYKKLQVITGDNNLASGNITNQGVAGKAIEAATEVAENPSNYSYKAYLQNFKGTAKNVELLSLDKFFLKDDSFDGYLKALGEEDVKYMRENAAEGMEMLMFDTSISVINDEADKAKWDARIEIALQQGQIGLDAVAELEMVQDQTYRSFLLAQAVKESKADQMKIAQQNSQANIAQAKAAADAKGQHDMMLSQQDHSSKMQQLDKEAETKQRVADISVAGQLKSKVIDAVMSNPEAKISDVPAFIWESLHITDESQKQLLLTSMQRAAQKQQMEQIAMQQAARAQQQQGQQAA